MSHDLPPLAALRAFEAAARHLSFTRAGAELGLTQAVVSYQIKLLEERVGTSLFLRRPRQVELTEAGRHLATAATEAFSRLADAVGGLRRTLAGVLSLKVHPTFAANWLAARLGRFQMRHPEIAVRVSTGMERPDFEREEIDLAVSWGRESDVSGLVSHALIESVFTPIVGREFAARAGGLRSPADLLSLRLVDSSDPWWETWFAQAGIAWKPPEADRHAKFGTQFLEGRAVLAGHGVGILTPAFFAEELADGRLVQPFPLLCRSGEFYWLRYPAGRRNLGKIRLFRDWLLAEIAQDKHKGAEPHGPAPRTIDG